MWNRVDGRGSLAPGATERGKEQARTEGPRRADRVGDIARQLRADGVRPTVGTMIPAVIARYANARAQLEPGIGGRCPWYWCGPGGHGQPRAVVGQHGATNAVDVGRDSTHRAKTQGRGAQALTGPARRPPSRRRPAWSRCSPVRGGGALQRALDGGPDWWPKHVANLAGGKAEAKSRQHERGGWRGAWELGRRR